MSRLDTGCPDSWSLILAIDACFGSIAGGVDGLLDSEQIDLGSHFDDPYGVARLSPSLSASQTRTFAGMKILTRNRPRFLSAPMIDFPCFPGNLASMLAPVFPVIFSQ